MRGFTIAQTMSTINLGLQNARKVPAIKKAIRVYGYDQKRLQQGDSLFHDVEVLRGNYDAKTFQAKQTHHSWKQKEKEAYAMYMDHLKLTRCALEDCPFLWNKMEMTGRRAYSFDGWTYQAKTLYAWILADETILKKLSPFNITPQKIQKGQQLVEEAIALRHAHIRLKAEAKQARVHWDKGLKRLKQWYSAFRALLRIALEETPAQLKAVGIPVRLSPRKSHGKPKTLQDAETAHSNTLSQKETETPNDFRGEKRRVPDQKVADQKRTDQKVTHKKVDTKVDTKVNKKIDKKATDKKVEMISPRRQKHFLSPPSFFLQPPRKNPRNNPYRNHRHNTPSHIPRVPHPAMYLTLQ